MKKLKYNHIIQNKVTNNKVIIGIHGWKGNIKSFIPLTKNNLFNDYDWILPEAPYSVDQINTSKSWSYQNDSGEWEINEPKTLLMNFFEEIVFKKYKSKDVYVIGFSQGALVCYEYICRIKKEMGGIFPIAGFVRNKKNILAKEQINTPIIIGETQEETKAVFIKKAKEKNAPICFADSHDIPFYQTDLQGNYQRKNIITCISTINVLREKEWGISNITKPFIAIEKGD